MRKNQLDRERSKSEEHKVIKAKGRILNVSECPTESSTKEDQLDLIIERSPGNFQRGRVEAAAAVMGSLPPGDVVTCSGQNTV